MIYDIKTELSTEKKRNLFCRDEYQFAEDVSQFLACFDCM